jgi:ribonuclease BN (tRNA processing enzyme)
MYTENEIKTKKGWGHSSIEQGLKFAEKLDLSNLIISHHSPDRTDQQINELIEKYSNYEIQFASENKNLKLWTE